MHLFPSGAFAATVTGRSPTVHYYAPQRSNHCHVLARLGPPAPNLRSLRVPSWVGRAAGRPCAWNGLVAESQVREHRCRRRARDAQPERQRLRADPPVDAHRSSPSMGNSKGLVACAPRRRRRYSPYVGEVYVAPGNTCLDERGRHRFAASQTGCGSQASRNSASPPASAPLAGDQLLQRNARRLVHRHAPERGACQLIAPAGLLAACVW